MNFFDNIKNSIIRFIKREEREEELIEYELLSPKEDINIKTKDALDFAFKSEKAKNIAITGNYSSGKSSTILSYINDKKISEDKIVNISLGTFKKSKNLGADILEKYIIDQMYFSTYKKIQELLNGIIKKFTIAIIILGVALFHKYIGDAIIFFIDSLKQKSFLKLLKHTYILLFITVFLTFIYIKIINFIFRMSLKFKMTLQYKDMKFEIENNSSNKTGYINQNIEQILDMLKRSKCKYVIFEDIDRFDNSEIFEHLKELNDIVNNSIDIKFIYLIRDDVFIGENRTKFFDFIYPVVPYISYGNSGEELYKLIEKYSLCEELPKDFIIQISYYVQDMRILKNVLNEYRVYSIDINTKGVDYKNLFSIILYKNIFSKDFSDLQNKSGNLYALFLKKEKLANEIRENIKKVDYNSEGEDGDEERTFKSLIASIKQIATSRGENATLFNSKVGEISLTNNKINSDFWCDRNTVIYLNGKEYKSIYNFVQQNGSSALRIDFENMVKKNISNNAEKNARKQKLEAQLNEIEEFSMADLLNRKILIAEEFDVFNDNVNNNIRKPELVQFLLREGYIKEDYERYISKFHEGTISPNDNDFIGNCQINRSSTFLLKLDDPELIIKKLDEKYFLNQGILNINIARIIFNIKNKTKQNNFINTFLLSPNIISNLTEINNRFTEDELKKFYTLLSRNISAFLIISEKADENNKEVLIKNLLLYSYLPNISKQDNVIDLKIYIEEENLLLLEKEKIESVKEIINHLHIEYADLSSALKNNIELFKYCIQNNFYQINLDNIKCIVRFIKGDMNFENDIDLKDDLSTIRKNETVYSYINENIKEYIENVYMLHENDNDEETIIELLNNEEINEHKVGIASREAMGTKYKIIDLSKIEYEELYNHLISINLVEANIDNINTFYITKVYNKEEENEEELIESKDIDNEERIIKNSKDILIEFINSNYNRIDRSIVVDDKEYSELYIFILTENNIIDLAYETLIKVINRNIKNIDITGLSESKLNILIDNNKIIFNNHMYSYIRKSYKNVFIRFTYINRNSIFGQTQQFEFTFEERTLILTDKQYNFDYRYKRSLIYSISNYKNIINDNGSSNYIIKYILDNDLEIDFSIQQLKVLINNCNFDRLRIRFIIYTIDKYDKEELKSIIRTYLPKYKKIIEDRTRPEYDYSQSLQKLIDALIKKGFNIIYDCEDNKIKIKGTIR